MNIRNHLIEIQCGHRDVNDVAQALIHSIIFFRTHGKFNYKHEGSYSIGTLGFERAFCDNFDFTYIRCSALSLVSRINNKVQEIADRIHEFTHSATISLEFFNKRPSRWPFNDSKIAWESWNIKISITPSTSSTATAVHQQLQVSPSSPPQPSHQQLQSSPSLAPVATSADTHHHQQYQQRKSDSALRLEDLLSHKLLDIVKIVNSEKCSLPQMPTQPNLDTVFDTSFSDLQPYLYNISYKINEIAPGSHSIIGGGAGSGGGGGGGTSSGYGGSGSAIGGGVKYSESGGVIDASAQSSLKKFLLGTLEL